MKKRSDCFFGLHFDMHAGENTLDIGKDFCEEHLDRLLKEVKPDFVQCDTKGHPGYASYPTKVGVHPQDICKDILRGWRDVTRRNDVALYGHHSGMWDYVAVKEHPEWSAVNAEGEYDPQATSLFGNYAEERLIPQLIEIARDYQLDGVWIDGDAWGVHPDYSEMAQKAWKEKSGCDHVPLPDEPEWREYLDFCRETFLVYARNYVKKVKEVCPDFEIASNWLNTEIAPVDDHITDFISGDLASTDCADSARFSARLIADYHRPWDLMAWGFYSGSNYKSVEQLCQELALVFSMGGSVQVYYSQSAQKPIFCEDAVIELASQIAAFCRDREQYCKNMNILPAVGVVYSAQAFYKDKKRVFADWEDMIYTRGARGFMNCVLDNQVPTEVLRASKLTERDLSAYTMLILPECPDMEADLPDNLVSYVEQGGTLVLSGVQTLKTFAPHLGYTYKEADDSPWACIFEDKLFAFANGPELQILGKPEPLKQMDVLRDGKAFLRKGTSLYRMQKGKGTVYLVPFNLGFEYYNRPSFVLNRFVRSILDEVQLPLRGYGSKKITISLCEKDGKHLIHLVNMHGESNSVHNECFEEIPPVYDFVVEYCVEKEPCAVKLQPSGDELAFTYENGTLRVRVPKIEIHCCIEISF